MENNTEYTSFSTDMNPLVRHIKKRPEEFTKEDIIDFVFSEKIEMINLCYPGSDGRMKKLNFPVKNKDYVDSLLEYGERVDGSSLFPYIDPGNSDVYVVPRYRSAFTDPFCSFRALNIMCCYFDNSGNMLDIGPWNITKRISKKIFDETGIKIKALGELEYYTIIDIEKIIYPSVPQRNYHETRPFVKGESLREEIMVTLSRCGVGIKYAHSEVGKVPSAPHQVVEQHEIELSLDTLEEMADQMTIAKWVIRNVADKHGVLVTFAPKLQVGHAGSGMHIHLCAEKDGKNIMQNNGRELSDTARMMIGGLLKFAKSITAFGNMVPTSFLRLVPNQEAPTKICWGYRNRSALIRVPLGWTDTGSMGRKLNYDDSSDTSNPSKQTFEIRSPDASANPYNLLAALGSAIYWGFTNSSESLSIAKDLFITGNIFKNPALAEKIEDLPASCADAAEKLHQERWIYEELGFPSGMIDGIITQLNKFEDRNILSSGTESDIKTLTERYLHCG